MRFMCNGPVTGSNMLLFLVEIPRPLLSNLKFQPASKIYVVLPANIQQ
jgi:hypothetical protein